MSYGDKLIDYFSNRKNVGSMKEDDPDVGTGLVGAPSCGDVMKFQIKVDPETGKIVDSKFKTFGCGSAIASSAFAAEHVRHMTVDQAYSVKNTVIAKELGLPPVKLHCSMLAEDAIRAALRDYKSKRDNKNSDDDVMHNSSSSDKITALNHASNVDNVETC